MDLTNPSIGFMLNKRASLNLYAPMVKLADTMDLGSIPETGRGSSPRGRTK